MRYAGVLVLSAAAVMAACSLAPAPTPGQGYRQYTWVDANGQVHVGTIPGGGRQEQATPGAGNGQPEAGAASAAPAVKPVPVAPDHRPDAPAAAAASAGEPAQAAGSGTLFAPDADFIDSEELEKKNFNRDGKKKFGEVVDVTGHVNTVYYGSGEGVTQPGIAPVQPTLPDVYPVLPVLPDDPAWPLRQTLDDCCQALLAREKTHPALELSRSYKVRFPSPQCLAAGSCEPVVEALDGKSLKGRKPLAMLRMRSYLSNLSCTRCAGWLTIVVLDRAGKPLRAYHPGLVGFRHETWMGYASFGYDIDLHPDDAYLLLLADAQGAVQDAGKTYVLVDKGEIAFSLIQ